MNHGMFQAAVAIAAVVIAGCSSAGPASGAGGSAALASSSGEPRWTTTIQQVAQTRFNAPDSSRDRSYGSAEWSRGNAPAESKINVAFTYSGPERDLSWAILFGRCGSASLTLLPKSSFPELEISGGGKAQLSATLSVELPTSGLFHIDIYKDRTGGAESLVGCGNLKYFAG